MSVSTKNILDGLDTTGKSERTTQAAGKHGRVKENSTTFSDVGVTTGLEPHKGFSKAWRQSLNSDNPRLYKAKVKQADLILFTTLMA